MSRPHNGCTPQPCQRESCVLHPESPIKGIQEWRLKWHDKYTSQLTETLQTALKGFLGSHSPVTPFLPSLHQAVAGGLRKMNSTPPLAHHNTSLPTNALHSPRLISLHSVFHDVTHSEHWSSIHVHWRNALGIVLLCEAIDVIDYMLIECCRIEAIILQYPTVQNSPSITTDSPIIKPQPPHTTLASKVVTFKLLSSYLFSLIDMCLLLSTSAVSSVSHSITERISSIPNIAVPFYLSSSPTPFSISPAGCIKLGVDKGDWLLSKHYYEYDSNSKRQVDHFDALSSTHPHISHMNTLVSPSSHTTQFAPTSYLLQWAKESSPFLRLVCPNHLCPHSVSLSSSPSSSLLLNPTPVPSSTPLTTSHLSPLTTCPLLQTVHETTIEVLTWINSSSHTHASSSIASIPCRIDAFDWDDDSDNNMADMKEDVEEGTHSVIDESIRLSTPSLVRPVTNATCLTHPLPRVYCPSLQWFEKECMQSHQPIIITGAIRPWVGERKVGASHEKDRKRHALMKMKDEEVERSHENGRNDSLVHKLIVDDSVEVCLCGQCHLQDKTPCLSSVDAIDVRDDPMTMNTTHCDISQYLEHLHHVAGPRLVPVEVQSTL